MPKAISRLQKFVTNDSVNYVNSYSLHSMSLLIFRCLPRRLGSRIVQWWKNSVQFKLPAGIIVPFLIVIALCSHQRD